MADTNAIQRIKTHADSLESVPHNKQFRADLYALIEAATTTPPADAALADDALIELVTDYAQSKVRAESCRYHYESAEYDKEAADTLEQIRAARHAGDGKGGE